jgi:hypothetical protein
VTGRAPVLAARMRSRLSGHPDAPRLLWRVGQIVRDDRLVFTVHAATAARWARGMVDGDLITEAWRLALKWRVTIEAVSPTGKVLIRVGQEFAPAPQKSP